MEPLRKAFEHYVSLSDTQWEDISSRWKPLVFPKDAFIIQPGEIEPYFYFVVEGVQRLYHMTPDGKEVVFGFSFTHSFSGEYDSFLHKSPSRFYLQSLTESRMLAMTLDDMLELFDRYKEMERWGRIFVQDILRGRIIREIEITSCTAEERFKAFMDRAPDILQTIPQRHLATYLNMTPETFSRMRAKRLV